MESPSSRPARAARPFLTIAWLVAALAFTAVAPFAGVVVALVVAFAFRAKRRLFLVVAVLLALFTLLYFPTEGGGIGSSGFFR
jgi:NADH:ubiquinone oxidoreductase subunit 5 (subunit L)/multisubunit Na+/H+ antiporter MnhA subunit